MTDLVVTWPKGRTLESYLTELRKADERSLVINYRISKPPKTQLPAGARLYRVYDGQVRGYTPIVEITYRHEGRVLDPVTGSFLRAGNFIVCWPDWHPVEPVAMKGFQGWHYIDREGFTNAA